MSKFSIILWTFSLLFATTAFCFAAEYNFSPEEIMYLTGIEMTAYKEGLRYAMYDIDKDGISELFVTDGSGRMQIFCYDVSADAPGLISEMDDVTEAYGDPVENRLVVSYGAGQKAYTIVNGSPEEQNLPQNKEGVPLLWIGDEQWVDGSIIGVPSHVPDPGPQNDFYLSSNYEWLSENNMDPDGESLGRLSGLEKNVAENKLKMLTDREKYTGMDIQRVRDYYDAATDWERREAEGVGPVKKYLSAAEGAETLSEFSALLTDPERNPFTFLLSITVTLDEKDTSHWVVELAEDAFSVLPRVYHNEEREEIEAARTDFDIRARHVLSRAGYSEEETERIMAECYELEEFLLPLAWPGEGDADSPLHGFQPYETVVSFCKNFPLERLLKAYRISGGKIHVYFPDYLEQLDRLYTEENLSMLKSYLMAHTAAAASAYLDLEAASCLEDGHAEKDVLMERLNKGYRTELFSSRSLMSVAVENAYMTWFADPETRADLISMAEAFRDSFRERLRSLDWLSDKGKAAAIEKLDNMSFSILSPEELIDSSYLAVDRNLSFLDIVARITVSRLKHNGAFTGKPREKGDWRYDLRPEISSSCVNAFYYGCFNQFFIFSGIVENTVYRRDMPVEEKLAFLSAIIGHELTHGFDPDGIGFDKNGNLVVTEDAPYGWMPEADHQAFMARAQKIADRFDNIRPIPYASCPGGTQWGEAAADIGGVTIGLDIAGKIDGFDYDRFFRAYSDLELNQSTLERERWDMFDAHPLSHLRVNVTLQQFDEFLNTYGIQEGDGMYLAEADRICIW